MMHAPTELLGRQMECLAGQFPSSLLCWPLCSTEASSWVQREILRQGWPDSAWPAPMLFTGEDPTVPLPAEGARICFANVRSLAATFDTGLLRARRPTLHVLASPDGQTLVAVGVRNPAQIVVMGSCWLMAAASLAYRRQMRLCPDLLLCWPVLLGSLNSLN